MPVVADTAWLKESSPDVRVSWVGHSTLLVQLGRFNLLTDPVFSERASPFELIGPRRHQPPGIAPADLPHIDAVVISHNHYDHLDLASVKALAASPAVRLSSWCPWAWTCGFASTCPRPPICVRWTGGARRWSAMPS